MADLQDHSVAQFETLDGRAVPVRVNLNPRARRISLRIDPARREAVLVTPSAKQLDRALAFAASRIGWIDAELGRLPALTAFEPGARIPLRGVVHELAQRAGRAGVAVTAGDPPILTLTLPASARFQDRARRYFMQEAQKDLAERVAAHAARLAVRPAALTVKDTRTRWGSCTVDGALSFSWRVVMAPPFVLDYLAAHEVAHLREMNHSARFWAHVRACTPHVARGRQWLRLHGAALHRYGAG